MKTLEIDSPIEIQRFVEVLNEHGRASLSAYWEICRVNGGYLDEVKYPVSRSVSGAVNKKAKSLQETGRIDRPSKSRGVAWTNFYVAIARRLKKLGLISIEKRGHRTFVRPLVGMVVFKVGDGQRVEVIEDIAGAHRLVRNLRGSSKTRQLFDKRLRYEVLDTVEIIFPGLDRSGETGEV